MECGEREGTRLSTSRTVVRRGRLPIPRTQYDPLLFFPNGSKDDKTWDKDEVRPKNAHMIYVLVPVLWFSW